MSDCRRVPICGRNKDAGRAEEDGMADGEIKSHLLLHVLEAASLSRAQTITQSQAAYNNAYIRGRSFITYATTHVAMRRAQI